MALLWKPKGLKDVDYTQVEDGDRVILVMIKGQLELTPCNHPEGHRHTFCLDRASSTPSLNEKLRSRGYLDENDRIINPRTFPHISLVGLPSIGDRPVIEFYVQRNWQPQQHLTGLIVDINFDNVNNLVRNSAA